MKRESYNYSGLFWQSGFMSSFPIEIKRDSE